MFLLERDLVDSLVLGVGAALRPRGELFKASEVTNGTRVVDIALADTEHAKSVVPDWWDFAPGFRRLDGRKTSLLAIVWRERRISVQRLARMTWTCADRLLAADIPELTRLGLVEINRRGTLRPTAWAEWSPGSLIAVEAKLADWRGALLQAQDHLAWADYSYVAMPAESALASKDAQRALRSVGVGGLIVGVDCRVTLRPRARRVPPQGAARERVALGLLGDMLAGSERWTALGAA